MILRISLLLAACIPLTTGCSSRSTSTTPRTAVEQLLLSRAVDRSLAKFSLDEMQGKKVYLDFTNLAATDVEYVRVAVRARFAEAGATLAPAADQADYTAEIASGALALEYKSGLIGLPPIPVPQSPIPLPEVAFYKTVEQTGIFKLLIFVHQNGRFVWSRHFYAKADRDESFLLWWRFQQTDDVRAGWEEADLELDDEQDGLSRNTDATDY